MNREQFMKWVGSLDPLIEFDDLDREVLFIAPSLDGDLLDYEHVVVVDSAEKMQFLALYIHEFRCAWAYKATKFGRTKNSPDEWWVNHEFNDGTEYAFTVDNFATDSEMIDFIIHLNDGSLPVNNPPDDSPIIENDDDFVEAELANPYRAVMNNAPDGYHELNSIPFDSLEQRANYAEKRDNENDMDLAPKEYGGSENLFDVKAGDEYLAHQATEMERLEKLMKRKFVHYCKTGTSVNVFQAGISQYQVGKPLYYLNEYRGINLVHWYHPKSLYELFCYMQQIAPLSYWQQS